EEEDVRLTSAQSKESILIPIGNPVNIEKIIDFAILIKEKKSTNPLTILRVVPNTEEAEKTIVKTQQELEKFLKETTASDTHATILTTIDHNAVSGISRIAKEIGADIIILGWPQKTGFLGKLIGNKVGSIFRRTRFLNILIGNKMESVLDNTVKTLFVC